MMISNGSKNSSSSSSSKIIMFKNKIRDNYNKMKWIGLTSPTARILKIIKIISNNRIKMLSLVVMILWYQNNSPRKRLATTGKTYLIWIKMEVAPKKRKILRVRILDCRKATKIITPMIWKQAILLFCISRSTNYLYKSLFSMRFQRVRSANRFVFILFIWS